MIIEIISSFLLIILINFFLLKFKILIDLSNKFNHKKLSFQNDLIPLSGGIIVLIIVNFFSYQNIFFFVSALLILLIGLCSDIDYIRSPKKRILFQFLIIFFYLYTTKNFFSDLRIEYINQILENNFYAILLNIFCFLVLVNGTNLIDGVNCSTIGYFLIISIILLTIQKEFNIELNNNLLQTLLIILSLLFFFNLFGKLYLGDGGSYLISFIFGSILIDISNLNFQISPYFIMCLLWYPAFENLFSIIRKSFYNLSFEDPDKKHLHHYIYYYLGNKFGKLNKKIVNSMTGLIILSYNTLYFLIIKKYYYFTVGLIISVIVNIFIYLMIYIYLNKNLFKKGSS